MTVTAQDSARPPLTATSRALWLIAALTLAHVIVLVLTPLNLHGDEAQYWAWSRTIDAGYFSKPPLIAWTIATTTAIFGNDEWAVRLSAPLMHGLIATLLYLLTLRMYGARAAFWAGVGWALMPGVQLSSVIISTDPLVLAAWSAALLCAWRLIETNDRRWAIGLGIALGAGLLAKYAMAYFLVGVALAILFSKRTRAALLGWNGLIALVVALIVVSPNLIWNATHHFATISHTVADTGLNKHLFHPDELLQFLTDQMGVVGPIPLALLFFLFFDAARRRHELTEADRFLAAFAAPALAIISLQALLNRANANWAVAAYPAAIVWMAGRFAGGTREWLLKTSMALHAGIALVFAAALLWPSFADLIGATNSLKRARGWNETAALISARVAALPEKPTAIMVDNRLLFYDLNYYWRAGAPAPLRMWQLEAKAGNSAETSAPMRAEDSGNVFIVMGSPVFKPFIFEDFTKATDAGAATIPLGRRKTRDLLFGTASGFAPRPRDAAFDARVHPDRYEK